MFETLTTEFDLDETLVRDYYRLNFALCVSLAESLAKGPGELPEVGSLGAEHVYFYLPLSGARTVSKYR